MEKKIVNNYGSFDVTFVKSKGSTMWDVNGKKYIDFIAGIGVNDCLFAVESAPLNVFDAVHFDEG